MLRAEYLINWFKKEIGEFAENELSDCDKEFLDLLGEDGSLEGLLFEVKYNASGKSRAFAKSSLKILTV